MQVSRNTVVTIDYTLRGDGDEVIDTSSGRGPMPYVHGSGAIIAGLEAALEGRAPGDAFTVSIEPADGYGDHDPDLRHAATLTQFGGVRPEVGMQFRVGEPADGGPVVTVVAVEGDEVLLDGNHPLAGVTLRFEVLVVGVRAATAREVESGLPDELAG